jgi:hypothetical protein
LGEDFLMSIHIINIRNAVSLNAENTIFDVEIEHPKYGWIPYTIHPDDTDDTIDNEALLELIGNDFTAYVAPTQAELDAQAAAGVRHRRDGLLQNEVDPIVSNPLRWADMTAEQQAAWAAYRTALLDITDQAEFPYNVTWPTKPE